MTTNFTCRSASNADYAGKTELVEVLDSPRPRPATQHHQLASVRVLLKAAALTAMTVRDMQLLPRHEEASQR